MSIRREFVKKGLAGSVMLGSAYAFQAFAMEEKAVGSYLEISKGLKQPFDTLLVENKFSSTTRIRSV